ncbi:MAG: nicotinate (nicotinamide) nucleotide adenylyltransferase [Paludibacter sp.]|nr:nicotinate (nicotinamide) nucleotide adenylyltransferase [Paludibacter sp.]
MRIAIYPGSFNPIHRGHVQLANYLLNEQMADEVWMVISPHNPLKMSSGLQEEHHRYEMTRLAVEGIPGLIPSTIEFSMPKPSYTIDTFQLLHQLHPEHEFALMIGSDNALVFDKWKEYRKLLDSVTIYVYPRRDYSMEEALKRYPEMKAINTPYYDISSTQLRHWLKRKEDTGDWLHPAVLEYISNHNLYF